MAHRARGCPFARARGRWSGHSLVAALCSVPFSFRLRHRYEPPLADGRSDIAAEMTGIRNELLEALKKRVERRRREKEKAKAKKAQRRGQQTISPVQKKSEESESRSGNGSGGAGSTAGSTATSTGSSPGGGASGGSELRQRVRPSSVSTGSPPGSNGLNGVVSAGAGGGGAGARPATLTAEIVGDLDDGDGDDSFVGRGGGRRKRGSDASVRSDMSGISDASIDSSFFGGADEQDLSGFEL